jgi:CSLREA domain-containing protein
MAIKPKFISRVSIFVIILFLSTSSVGLTKSAKAYENVLYRQNYDQDYDSLAYQVIQHQDNINSGKDQDWTKAGLGIKTVNPEGNYVVNTTSDLSDGDCDETHCSLREAILSAYYNPGPDTITFNIPASDPGCDAAGVCVIRPTSSLPEILDGDTTIDGFSQPGASPNSNPSGLGLNAVYKIVLDGSSIQFYPAGISLRSSGNLVRGLVIQNFYDGIDVVDADDNHIEGNFIGTNAQGDSAAGNACHGVSISGVMEGAGSKNNVLGGSNPQARNLISGNGCVGVGIGPVGNNIVQGNIIGADASGTQAIPNAGKGIRVFNVSNNNLIGGQASGEANLIAFNGGDGVEIDGSYGAQGNTITRNRIHTNLGLGIALLGGANVGLVAPAITALSDTYVSGTACPTCTIEVFSDTDGEGAVFEGSTTADASGIWSFNKPGGIDGPNVTATATDGDGNTSQFSMPANIPGAFEKTSPDNGATGILTNPTLTWEDSTGATSYEYCYDTTNDNVCSSWVSTGMDTSIGLSDLSLNTSYFWQVIANNAFGSTYANGSQTAFWSFTTVGLPTHKIYLPLVLK